MTNGSDEGASPQQSTIDELRMLIANASDIITSMLNDQESLREPFRNEALCEEARAFLSHMDYINRKGGVA